MSQKEEIFKQIRDFLEGNEEIFNETAEELDRYCGYLDGDCRYPMADLEEYLCGMTHMEVLNRTFCGGDDDTKDANGIRGEFNPNRKYFYWNGYGNLCSTDYKDYSGHLDDYFVKELIDDYSRLYIDSDLEALCEDYDYADEEGGEE